MTDASKPQSEKVKREADMRAWDTHEGSAGKDAFEIYMERKVFDDIADISRANPHRALGGILFGRVLTNQGASLILIEGHVVAEHTEEYEGNILFTPDSWQQINSAGREFPLWQIIGWFHIQPGAGTAIASADKFLHNNCADLPWQIAYLVDPLNCTEELFCLAGGEIVSSGFKIAADAYGQKPSVLDCLGCIKRWQFQDADYANKRPVLLITVLAILLFAGNAYYWVHARTLSGQIGRLQQYVSQLENSNRLLADRVNNKQYWHHVVTEGETLADISNNFYGSEDYAEDIAVLNKLSDVYGLQVGQEILIPTIDIERPDPQE